MSDYFSAFPSTSYANTVATNILLRASISDYVLKNNVTFYPYTITDNDRPDQIAYYYYDDPSFAWLVMFSNQVVDPYYQWPLDNISFENMLKAKYGSVSASQQQTAFYRTNWAGVDTVLNNATFDALATNLKKFWEPVLSENKKVYGYKRKKQDLVVSTNKTIKATVVSTNSKSFQVGERVSVISSSIEVAVADIAKVTSTSVTLTGVEGSVAVDGSYSLSGITSGATASVTTIDSIVNNIPTNEASYWERVTLYEVEVEKNEQRKHIKLIDKVYKDQIYRELENLLNE